MNVDDIIQTIAEQHGGAWWGLFHSAGRGRKFLPTGHVLTPAAYLAVVRHFTGEEPVPKFSAEERKRNTLRGKAQGKGEEYE